MEKELDAIKASVEEMKRSLVALAREQAEQVKNQIVSEANETMKEELDRATQEAQKKAKEIIGTAIQRCAADYVVESTVTIPLIRMSWVIPLRRLFLGRTAVKYSAPEPKGPRTVPAGNV